ncbi:hypothetical protein AAC387_Pa08g0738 [Persea americana]
MFGTSLVVEGDLYGWVWEVVDASEEYEAVEGDVYRCVWEVVDASKEYEVVEGDVYRCVWEVVDASEECEVVEGDVYRCVWEVVDASKEYETELVEPALAAGTQNVLRACSEAGVERLIAVSSIAAVAMNPNWPQDRPMDENSWTDIDYCKSRQSKDFFNSTVIDIM